MKFQDFGIANSLLWSFIAIFLFFGLGSQLLFAVTNLEIQNLRVTDMISFYSRPIWFSFIVCVKEMLWGFSLLIIYKYAKSKLKAY